jgi:hypothetical protein
MGIGRVAFVAGNPRDSALEILTMACCTLIKSTRFPGGIPVYLPCTFPLIRMWVEGMTLSTRDSAKAPREVLSMTACSAGGLIGQEGLSVASSIYPSWGVGNDALLSGLLLGLLHTLNLEHEHNQGQDEKFHPAAFFQE